MKIIWIRTESRTYPVFIARGALDRVGDLIRERLHNTETVVVVTDEKVSAALGKQFRAALRSTGVKIRKWIELPAGERTKTLGRVRTIYQTLAGCGADRWTPVVAVGGGVVGDVAGFAAATFMRGVPLIHVPTTVIAQVDSSIGGKTAVNFRGAKNLVGCFYQPEFVVTDPETLATLPIRDYQSGLAEVIKVAVTLRPDLVETLEQGLDRLNARDIGLLTEVVTACVEAKGEVVSRDERDQDVRAILNYGHTIGHAVESAGKGRIRHGEAVAVGMNAAAWIGETLGVTQEGLRQRQNSLLTGVGLKLTIPGADKRVIVRNLKLDKKLRARKNRFVLTLQIGGASVWPHISSRLLRDAVRLVAT